MSAHTEYASGTRLFRNDGYTAQVVACTTEEAILEIQPPEVDGQVQTAQEWRGSPAALVNCWLIVE